MVERFWNRSRTAKPVEPTSEPSDATVGRPLGASGDTGLRFTGWYIAANNSLSQASRDDDPRCMKVFCAEARVAALTARDHAVNDRQIVAADKLLEAIKAVRDIAEKTPPLP